MLDLRWSEVKSGSILTAINRQVTGFWVFPKHWWYEDVRCHLDLPCSIWSEHWKKKKEEKKAQNLKMLFVSLPVVVHRRWGGDRHKQGTSDSMSSIWNRGERLWWSNAGNRRSREGSGGWFLSSGWFVRSNIVKAGGFFLERLRDLTWGETADTYFWCCYSWWKQKAVGKD